MSWSWIIRIDKPKIYFLIHCLFINDNKSLVIENLKKKSIKIGKPIIPPKIAISKKNFNIKNEVDKLSEDFRSNHQSESKDECSISSDKVAKNIIDSSFNPFEVSKKPEVKINPKHWDFVVNKSKSDLGNTGWFLNKVEGSQNAPNRHSEALKYNHNYIHKEFKNDVVSIRSDEMITSKWSRESKTNKEGSTNLENSIISNQISSAIRFSDVKNSSKEWSTENTPIFMEELSNPFGTCEKMY